MKKTICELLITKHYDIMRLKVRASYARESKGFMRHK